MLSVSAKSAISKLCNVSPAAKYLVDQTVKPITIDRMELASESSDNALLEDNQRLKSMVLTLSETVAEYERIIETLTQQLEKLNAVEQDVNVNVNVIVNKPASYLASVYGVVDNWKNIEPAVRYKLCCAFVDKFTAENQHVPELWHKIISARGDL